MTEDELARAVLGPAELATFERVYREHASEAWRMARAFLADSAMAADAVHTAFLQILRYLLRGNRLTDNVEARALVLRNTRWAALNLLRARRTRLDVPLPASAEAELPEVEWVRSETRSLCEQIVRGLPRNHQAVLHAHYVEDLADADAARALGLSAGAYRQRLNRALAGARRAARSQGIAAAFGSIGALLHPRRMRAALRAIAAPFMPATKLLVTAGLVATAAVAAPRALAVSGQSAEAVAQRLPASEASASTALLTEVPDDAQIVSVAASGDPPDLTVMALGRGKACGCWVLFRSSDNGATWDPTPGPSAGLTESQAVAAALNFEGQSPMRLLPPLSCVSGSGYVTCKGHRVDGMVSAQSASPGTLVVPSPDLMLYLIPGGGILCSPDGNTWVLRCG